MHTLLRKVFILCVIFAIAACVDTPNTRQTAAQESQNFPLRGPAGVRSKAAAPKQLPTGRVALVIGNSAYTVSGLELINPVNDARAMATTLERLGFKVRRVENANLTVMRDAVSSFNRQLTNNQGVGIFYFAGHGMKSASGLNYLIPVDFKPENGIDVAAHSVDADSVRESMESSNNALNIAILDACRDDPFKTRGLGQRGLARMEARGSLVALATAPGAVALDGEGANGLYTSYLLKHILTPGIDVREVFDRVGRDVADVTDNRQQPWYHTSVQGQFTFVPVGTVMPALPIAAPTQVDSRTDSTSTRALLIDFAMFQDNGSGAPVRLQDGATLRSGDGYFFHIKTTGAKQNYIYLFQVDASGKVFRLFPSSQYHTAANPVPARTRVTLPNEREVFFLDDTVGEEKIYFLASSDPVPSLEQLENGTIDDIMNSGFPLRGPAGVRAKIATVASRLGETNAPIQEFKFIENLVYTLSINHE